MIRWGKTAANEVTEGVAGGTLAKRLPCKEKARASGPGLSI